jgi:hypothetical protein
MLIITDESGILRRPKSPILLCFFIIIQTTIWVLLPICTLALVGCFLIRLHLYRQRNRRRRFGANDALLFFATACAIAGASVSLHYVDDLYFALQPLQLLWSRVGTAELEQRIMRRLYTGVTCMQLSMLSVRVVKFSFFAFFRQLLHGQAGRVMARWWAAFGVTGAASVYIMLTKIFMCPYFGNFKKLGESFLLPQHALRFGCIFQAFLQPPLAYCVI